MLVLDDTYISPEVLEFAQASQEPIFDNTSAQRYASQGVNSILLTKVKQLMVALLLFLKHI